MGKTPTAGVGGTGAASSVWLHSPVMTVGHPVMMNGVVWAQIGGLRTPVGRVFIVQMGETSTEPVTCEKTEMTVEVGPS